MSSKKLLRNDLNKRKREKKLLIPADKTSNYYKLSSEQYVSLITKGIQKEYKKTNEKIVWQVNAEDKRIAEKLELSDRIDVTAKKEAFITFKDHKENFRNKPTCRLINPCKPELGKVSKQIVEKIVHNIRTKTNTNQWKNTNDVINWFNAIKDKSNYTMICFDICDFYSSITNTLLQKALNYASKYADIKNLPKGIEIPLSNNSANADIFQEAAKPYNNVLKNNGDKEEIKIHQRRNHPEQKRRNTQ